MHSNPSSVSCTKEQLLSLICISYRCISIFSGQFGHIDAFINNQTVKNNEDIQYQYSILRYNTIMKSLGFDCCQSEPLHTKIHSVANKQQQSLFECQLNEEERQYSLVPQYTINQLYTYIGTFFF